MPPGDVIRDKESGVEYVITDGTQIIEIWAEARSGDGQSVWVKRIRKGDQHEYQTREGKMFEVVPAVKITKVR